MVNLPSEDRLALLDVLTQLPTLHDPSGIRSVLAIAGLEALIPSLTLQGPTAVMLGGLLHALQGYGPTAATGQEALTLFLNILRTPTYTSPSQQQELETIIRHAHLPLEALRVASTSWKGPATTEQVLEQVFRENTLHPIAFLQQALLQARAVAS